MIYEQGDIVSINFDPSLGHEPAMRHYAIVISPWQVNSMCALTLLAPVTSNDNGFPLHVSIAEGNPIHGHIQCEALRAIDLDTRSIKGAVEHIGSIDDQTMARVLACVKVVAGVD